MSTSRSRSLFEAVPDSWFEPVVGLWVLLLAGFGMGFAVEFGSRFLAPLGAAPWAAVAVALFVAAVAYGGFGVALTHGYRTFRGFEPRLLRTDLDAAAVRWLASLCVLAPLLMVLGGLLSGRGYVAAQLLGFGLPAQPDGMSGLALGLTGVNEMVNQAPLVLVAMVLAGLLMGPAVGAVFHGVLQDTLATVAPPAVAVAGTATVATVVLASRSVTSPTTVVVFAFVLAVAYAYRETDDLLVAMAAYGAFDALALLLAWVDILASLHAAGHLFG